MALLPSQRLRKSCQWCVKQESKSSFCPEKANPAGDEFPLLFCAKHTRKELFGKLSSNSSSTEALGRSLGSSSSQEKLDGLHNSPNAAVQVCLTPRLPPHCRWCWGCLLLKHKVSKLLVWGFFSLLGESRVSNLFLLTGLRMYSKCSRLKSSKERVLGLSFMTYIFAFIKQTDSSPKKTAIKHPKPTAFRHPMLSSANVSNENSWL